MPYYFISSNHFTRIYSNSMVFAIISVILSSYPCNNYILNTTAKQRCAACNTSIETQGSRARWKYIAYTMKFQKQLKTRL